jgi:osmoprotectant transport system substrate-binding protein
MGGMGLRVRHRVLAGAVALAACLGLGACSTPDDGGPGQGETITIGSQGTVESETIAQLYGQLLAENGFVVDYNTGVGQRAAALAGLQSGIIDVYPDTSGALLYEVTPDAFERRPNDVVEALPTALADLRLHVLGVSPAEAADAFVVTREFSDTNLVTSIGDLAYLANRITIGADAGFENSPIGRLGLLETYDVTGFAFRAIDDGGVVATVGELLTDVVQVSVVSSTTPAILRNDLVVLRDPNNLVIAQNILPVVNERGYAAAVSEVLNPLSKRLTTADLRELADAGTAADGPTPERVARAWLQANGLLPAG